MPTLRWFNPFRGRSNTSQGSHSQESSTAAAENYSNVDNGDGSSSSGGVISDEQQSRERNSVFRVTVPSNIGPGHHFLVIASNNFFHVACPHGAQSGQQIEISLPVLGVGGGGDDGENEQPVGHQTPLHLACRYRSSVEAASPSWSRWPGTIIERDINDLMPLHVACSCRASAEVVSLLLKNWPNEIKKKDRWGRTPLHLAHMYGASVEVVSLLVSSWVGAIKEKDRNGRTPLHVAYSRSASEDVKTLLSHASTLYSDEANNSSILDILSFFIDMEWRYGMLLLINRHPNITKSLDLQTHVMAGFFSVVGKGCSLRTMWAIIENEQDLLKDA
uniref:Uncharacterized protein n=1 Tax=Ditylum brightwellii TaxID=49249 RepID=A0A7S4VDF3_9STRA